MSLQFCYIIVLHEYLFTRSEPKNYFFPEVINSGIVRKFFKIVAALETLPEINNVV